MTLSLLQAIQQLETGGTANPYGYVSPSGAIGAYGMTPGTIDQFSAQAGYAGITPAQFQANPTAQDAIAAAALNSYAGDYGGDVAKIGQAWLGGPGSVGATGVTDPVTGISTTQYGANLVGLVGSTATSATSNSPLAEGIADYGTGYGFSGSSSSGGFLDNLMAGLAGQGVASPLGGGLVAGSASDIGSTIAGITGLGDSVGNTLTGWVGDVENWFVRGGLIIVGCAVVIVGLVYLLDPKMPAQVIGAMAA